MRKRTKALDIPKRVKDRVWERDGGRCILCGETASMPNAHYIPRSQGGLGVEENVVTLCFHCHSLYDNSQPRPYLRREIEEYLKSQYPNWERKKLIYRKDQQDV